jgi:DNA-binding NarL/FixJ family response regulator
MTQITVLLAVASPMLHAKLRSEIMYDPHLALVYDAGSAADAVTQTRLHQPQVVLCDRAMLADGHMNVISQQARVVSLLVLVTISDDCTATRVPVPVAGTVPFNRRPGDLAGRLQVIIEAPASFIEPAIRLQLQRPPSQRLTMEPFPYDAGRIPSLPRSGRLMWLSDPQPAPPSPTTVNALTKNSFLKSVFDMPEKQ